MQAKYLIIIGVILLLASTSYATVIDNFNDGNHLINPTWVELVGTGWDASNNYLTTTTSGDRAYTILDTNIDASGATTIQCDYYETANIGGRCSFQASPNDYQGNGYGFFKDGGNIHFAKFGGGTWVSLVNGGALNTSTWYTLKATRTASGGWTFEVEDVNKGTAEDTTYTNLGTILTGYNGVGTSRWDNIEYTTGGGASASITTVIETPNGGEDWSLTLSPQTIDFNITTILDINGIRIDMNYGTTGTQGTGTSIIMDQNTGNQGLNCDTNTGTTHTCHYDWNYSGVTAGNYFIGILADDNGSISSYDASNASFEISTPVIEFWLNDENGDLRLSGVTITDGTETRTTDPTGYTTIDLNYYSSTSTHAIFTISKTGYGTRYYETDINSASNKDVNFTLLQTGGYATDVDFEIWNDNGTRVLNTYVEVTKDGNIVGRRKTNGYGKTTFFLNEFDTNYNFLIEESTAWDTNLGLVQVNRPKTEGTNTNIDGNWAVNLKAGSEYPLQKISTNAWSILIIPNTLSTYNFTVYMLIAPGADQNIDDTNYDSTYGKRTYATRIRGDADGKTYTIQPYLQAGLTYMVVQGLESITEKALGLAIVEIYRAENDTYPVTSCELDNLGKCQVYLDTTINYYYKVTNKSGVELTFLGLDKWLATTITGNTIQVIADAINTFVYGPGVFTTSHTGTVDVDTNVTVFYTKKITDANISITYTKPGTTTTLLATTNQTTNGQWSFIATGYGTPYQITAIANGTTIFDTNITTKTLAQTNNENYYQNAKNTLTSEQTNAQTITIILAIIILTLAIIMGTTFKLGLETLFIGTWIITFLNPTNSTCWVLWKPTIRKTNQRP